MLVSAKKLYTVKEYFALEEAGEIRHSYIDGKLLKIPDSSTEHYLCVKRVERLLEAIFEIRGYLVYRENMKVKIHGQKKYYYPDVFITKEANNENNRYAKYEPELIVEVSSKSTIKMDLVDKLIAYQKIPFYNTIYWLNQKKYR